WGRAERHRVVGHRPPSVCPDGVRPRHGSVTTRTVRRRPPAVTGTAVRRECARPPRAASPPRPPAPPHGPRRRGILSGMTEVSSPTPRLPVATPALADPTVAPARVL